MRKIGHDTHCWTRCYRSLLLLLVGFCIGCFLVKYYHRNNNRDDPSAAAACLQRKFNAKENLRSVVVKKVLTRVPNQSRPKKFILVGVMTANKYLNTRAVAVQKTWSNLIEGEVKFFSSAGVNDGGLPVVNLPGVDDTYPPQKKSFLMLKYLHDNYLDEYEWFVRSDDDAFIHGRRLATFLRKLNSSQPLYIGQAGIGVGGKNLVLQYDENYCMGGTTIAFSRETLKRMVPHINYCLKHLYTKHEDVEIGRCVHMFAGIQCPWAFEMQSLFYQNHDNPQGSFERGGKLHEMYKAITMHPVKNPQHLYRMYNHFLSAENADSRHTSKLLRRDVKTMEILLNASDPSAEDDQNIALSLLKFKPHLADEVLTWNFLQRHFYSATDLNPRRGVDKSFHNALHKVLIQVMKLVNGNSQQKGRTIDYKDILYGYHRVDPVHGVDYIFDLLLLYKKFTGSRKRLDVRRHTYFHQTFADLEVSFPNLRENKNAAEKSAPRKKSHGVQRNVARSRTHTHRAATKVHFILPILGRVETFARFLRNFAATFLVAREPVSLSVMLFEKENAEALKIRNLVRDACKKFPFADVAVYDLEGEFSRSVALDSGSKKRADADLLFFVDVDVFLSRDALSRIRLHTIRGKQVYYPIVFSQYDPTIVCELRDCTADPFNYAVWRGYWRIFGYGISSIYKSDLNAIGGFDTTIKGWGLEDVKIFENTLSSGLRVFRAPDVGMVHIFHPVICDKNLSKNQYDMCLGTKASSLSSVPDLETLIREKERTR